MVSCIADMTSRARAIELAGLLEAVAFGELSSSDALGAWGDVDSDDPQAGKAWHALHHFEADQDLRFRDGDYDDRMRSDLRALARELSSPGDSG